MKNNMKMQIYTQAKKLFYDQGYTNTTTAQLAEYCQTSKGSIAYYFKTKANLANFVYNTSISNVKDLIKARFDIFNLPYDLQIATAVEIRVITKMLQDRKTFRFYNELYADSGFSSIIAEAPIDFWKYHDDTYGLQIDQGHDELQIISILSRSMATALTLAFFNGYLTKTSFEDILTIRLKSLFSLIKTPAARIDTIIEQSQLLEEQFSIIYQPYFEIK